MKKVTLFVLFIALISASASAGSFSPTLLKLSVSPIVQYNFDGTDLQIPVQVSGTDALLWFYVYTKEQAENIGPVQNGFLGWHYVNKIDTCIYMSSSLNFSKGNNLVQWDGNDNDGNTVPAGNYTYYMWAYDAFSAKIRMTKFISGFYHSIDFQEVDEMGNPLVNPILISNFTEGSYRKEALTPNSPSQKWIVGSDPMDSTLIESCKITVPPEWSKGNNLWMDQKDFNYVYFVINNRDKYSTGLTKWKWVPNDYGVLVSEFGKDGYLTWSSEFPSGSNVVSDYNYLYTVDQDNYSPTGYSNLLVSSFDGEIITELDMLKWWGKPDEVEKGGTMNGGPNDINISNGKLFFNCHCSCLNQMVDPIAWLDSNDDSDFYLWCNGNGDYVLDKNWEKDSAKPWVCNDYKVGPYKYNISPDANFFSCVPSFDMGAVTFGLLAPDGTGVGYLALSGETAGWKLSNVFLDGGTPFDGLYFDNNSSGGLGTKVWDTEETRGTWFIGHDSVKGVLTNVVAVDETPSAFAVAQNSPNPFNPATTISFSIAEAGNVAIDVFNVAGQKVDTIADEFMGAGNHTVSWDGSGFSAGVYFYTVKSGDFSRTMKMTLLK